MVGFRVFDIGGLVAWLVWFSKQHDEDDGDDDGGGRGPDDGVEPREPPPGLPGSDPWPHRLREHGDRRSPDRPRRPHRPVRDREVV